MLEPVTLRGTHVQLEPFAESHVPGLWAAATEQSLFRYMPFLIRSEDELGMRLRGAMRLAEARLGLGMVQRAVADEIVVGATGFWNVDVEHRRVEIGSTWITPRWQRTAINTEAKLLMMTLAFEVWGCIRVEFKTDSENARSRAALRRIGATEEGTLRNHMVMPTGRYRHSTYFSVLDSEWPAVKATLESLLHDRRL